MYAKVNKLKFWRLKKFEELKQKMQTYI